MSMCDCMVRPAYGAIVHITPSLARNVTENSDTAAIVCILVDVWPLNCADGMLTVANQSVRCAPIHISVDCPTGGDLMSRCMFATLAGYMST
jgi:hypothetical protein